MKKAILFVLAALLLLLAALALSLRPARLDVPSEPISAVAVAANPPASMRMSSFLAGYMQSQKLFTYRGGELGEPYVSGMLATLIEHPNGNMLIDTGFGRDVDAQFLQTPALMQALASYEKETPVADQLKAAGYQAKNIRAIFLTHSHWDHVSGAPDLVPTPVLVPEAGLKFIRSGSEMSALARDMQHVNYRAYTFNDGPYEAFERSHNVYGDGSVVAVPMPGHTPGSVGIFVNLPSGKRYLFVGDLVWAKEGYQLPAERPWLSRRIVDHDPQAVRDMVVKIHRLSQLRPELIVVPAHDRRVHQQLAIFPEFER